MAPPKLPKKVAKLIEKPIEKPISKMKKKGKKNYQSFSIYIFRVLRTVTNNENIRISSKTMLIMNNFVNDMLENVASEAGRLVAHGKKTTMNSRDIQSAVKLLIPGELAKHAISEALKAVTLYHNSRERDAN